MPSRPEFKEYIRTLVRGDGDANDQVGAALDAAGWEGFARFQSALFSVTVERRFGPTIVEPDVAGFVAGLRSDVGPDGPAIDTAAAETLIRSIIEESVDYDIEPAMIGTIQALTAYKLLTEQVLSDQDLDGVLAEAEQLATTTAPE